MSSDAAGVTRSRTRANDLIPVSRGIRIPAGSELQGPSALAAYTEVNPGSVLSHHSAANVWGIPLPPRLANDWRIHLANPALTQRVRRVNTIGHRLALRPGEVVDALGIRLTSAARTWLDLATQLSVEELVAAGDYLVCSHDENFPMPQRELCSLEELEWTIQQHPGLRGLRIARQALALVRVGADSAPETAMRLALVSAGLPEPELNVMLVDQSGRPALWPDAAYREFRICLQYDGVHHAVADQYLRDMRRFEVTRSLGWDEVRLGSDDLHDHGAGAVRKVAAALRAKGWRPQPPIRLAT